MTTTTILPTVRPTYRQTQSIGKCFVVSGGLLLVSGFMTVAFGLLNFQIGILLTGLVMSLVGFALMGHGVRASIKAKSALDQYRRERAIMPQSGMMAPVQCRRPVSHTRAELCEISRSGSRDRTIRLFSSVPDAGVQTDDITVSDGATDVLTATGLPSYDDSQRSVSADVHSASIGRPPEYTADMPTVWTVELGLPNEPPPSYEETVGVHESYG